MYRYKLHPGRRRLRLALAHSSGRQICPLCGLWAALRCTLALWVIGPLLPKTGLASALALSHTGAHARTCFSFASAPSSLLSPSLSILLSHPPHALSPASPGHAALRAAVRPHFPCLHPLPPWFVRPADFEFLCSSARILPSPSIVPISNFVVARSPRPFFCANASSPALCCPPRPFPSRPGPAVTHARFPTGPFSAADRRASLASPPARQPDPLEPVVARRSLATHRRRPDRRPPRPYDCAGSRDCLRPILPPSSCSHTSLSRPSHAIHTERIARPHLLPPSGAPTPRHREVSIRL